MKEDKKIERKVKNKVHSEQSKMFHALTMKEIIWFDEMPH